MLRFEERSFSLVFFLVGLSLKIWACTTLIVSGKASADGRPFIFKNRDATENKQAVVLLKGEKYRYIAIVDSSISVKRPESVASGFNETGFSIINSIANNMNGALKDVTNNTVILRRALEICRSLEDFETLLDTLPKPLHVDSNYGVMDARGGIAYYETGNNGYVKYDANDSKVAPDGILIRSNFAFSGNENYGKGFERYIAMEMYIDGIKKGGKIKFEDIIKGAPRYLTHGGTKVNLMDIESENDEKMVVVDFDNFIPRRQTVSAQLVQGVKRGDNPIQTTAWTICGNPLTTICVPVWMTADGTLPKLLTRNSSGCSPLCDTGLKLKNRLFPISIIKSEGKEIINLVRLINKSGTGILQRILPIEDEIFRRARVVQRDIRKNKKVDKGIIAFYDWADHYVLEEYNAIFGR